MVAAALPDTAFMAVEASRLTETLCVEDERTVGRDNTIAWDGLRLQIPESPLRRHYVQARVKVHAYPDGRLAVLHGPRVIGRYSGDGVLQVETAPAATRGKKVRAAAPASVASRSSPSRCGLARAVPAAPPERRPTLTAPSREAKTLACRKAKKRAA